MRALAWALVSFALVACESSVDLCGSGAVCSTDGVTYDDTCQLEAAGATLAYGGRCTGECRDCGDYPCLGEPILDARGCPTCTCTCRDGECPDGLDCAGGICVPKDGGMPPTDGAIVDGAGPDVDVPDASGCAIDSDCAPGRCEGGICIYDCDETRVDCDGDDRCETVLGRVDSCGDCDDDCTLDAPASTTPVCTAERTCEYPCVLGHERCEGSETCTDVRNDRLNCGRCGQICSTSQICASSACARCPDGTIACGNECVDLRDDPSNCGACGRSCSGSETCWEGDCVDSDCLDPSADTWSCTGSLDACRCTCDELAIDVGPGGIVTCLGALPGLGCILMEVGLDCESYEPDVAACCLP